MKNNNDKAAELTRRKKRFSKSARVELFPEYSRDFTGKNREKPDDEK